MYNMYIYISANADKLEKMVYDLTHLALKIEKTYKSMNNMFHGIGKCCLPSNNPFMVCLIYLHIMCSTIIYQLCYVDLT